jgi:hypothetical protein
MLDMGELKDTGAFNKSLGHSMRKGVVHSSQLGYQNGWGSGAKVIPVRDVI